MGMMIGAVGLVMFQSPTLVSPTAASIVLSAAERHILVPGGE